MTLEEILRNVDILVPNSLPTDIKIQWINQINRQLFRDYPLPEAFYLFQAQNGVQLYELPPDCPEDRIKKVTIGERDFDYHPITSDDSPERFWTIVSGRLLIHPAPKTEETGMVYYKQRPIDLTINDIDKEVGFNQDYQNLMVFGCCELVALSNPDTFQLSSTYAAKFADLAEKANRDITKFRSKNVRVVNRWA